MNPTTKRYRYECKCGKNPLRGTIAVFTPAAERAIFDVIDLAWAQSHNDPGCTLKNKTVEPYSRRAESETTALSALLIAAVQVLFVFLLLTTVRGLVNWLLPTDAMRLARMTLGMIIGLPLVIFLGRLLAVLTRRTS